MTCLLSIILLPLGFWVAAAIERWEEGINEAKAEAWRRREQEKPPSDGGRNPDRWLDA